MCRVASAALVVALLGLPAAALAGGGLRLEPSQDGLDLAIAPDWGARFLFAHADVPAVRPSFSLAPAAASPSLRAMALERHFGAQSIEYRYAPSAGRLTGADPGQGIGFGAAHRLQWSLAVAGGGRVGLSYATAPGTEDAFMPASAWRHGGELAVFGRYRFAPRWSLSAEAFAREHGDPGRASLRLGLHHRF